MSFSAPLRAPYSCHTFGTFSHLIPAKTSGPVIQCLSVHPGTTFSREHQGGPFKFTNSPRHAKCPERKLLDPHRECHTVVLKNRAHR